MQWSHAPAQGLAGAEQINKQRPPPGNVVVVKIRADRVGGPRVNLASVGPLEYTGMDKKLGLFVQW